MAEAALLIFQTTRRQAEPDLRDTLTQVEALGGRIKETRLPAVHGELAGTALQVLLSEPVQAFINAIELGGAFWLAIAAARRVGRKVWVGKPAARVMGAAKVESELLKELRGQRASRSEIVVWGPMHAEPIAGFKDTYFFQDVAGTATVHLVAFVVPWPNRRARTYWYLISDSGELCASWYTQTLRSRLPDFLKPRTT